MPHILEFADEPHQVLREVERVLVPEGHLVITGFNPASLWGLRQAAGALRRFAVSAARRPASSQPAARQGLAQAAVVRGQPRPLRLLRAARCAATSGSQRWRFMEKAGDRWWPFLGAVYLVHRGQARARHAPGRRRSSGARVHAVALTPASSRIAAYDRRGDERAGAGTGTGGQRRRVHARAGALMRHARSIKLVPPHRRPHRSRTRPNAAQRRRDLDRRRLQGQSRAGRLGRLAEVRRPREGTIRRRRATPPTTAWSSGGDRGAGVR